MGLYSVVVDVDRMDDGADKFNVLFIDCFKHWQQLKCIEVYNYHINIKHRKQCKVFLLKMMT